MTTTSIPAVVSTDEGRFQADQVISILAGHFFHDIYTAAVAPLLPVLIEKLSLSLASAGSLSAIMQLPSLINPLIGYLADRVNVRYFIIFAPAITATLISMIGFAPGYWHLAILLFCVGVSTASFHAPAPGMVARLSGRRLGMGMGLFMAAGELGYTIGPLLVVWAVSTWTLDGMWRIIVLGWGASLVLLWRLGDMRPNLEKPGSLRAIAPSMLRVFLPMGVFILFRNPLTEGLSTYLPVYLTQKGADLWIAGASLSIVQIAGVAGVLTVGWISDRLGRKRVLMAGQFISAVLMGLFLLAGSGVWSVPLLLAMGFVAFSPAPLLLVIVQEAFPNNRAVANGFYMMLMFLLRPLGTLAVGLLGDWLGLTTTYMITALIALLTLPAIWMMPSK